LRSMVSAASPSQVRARARETSPSRPPPRHRCRRWVDATSVFGLFCTVRERTRGGLVGLPPTGPGLPPLLARNRIISHVCRVTKKSGGILFGFSALVRSDLIAATHTNALASLS
jgi:hypothetical protein